MDSQSEHLHFEVTPEWVIEREPTLAEVIPIDEISDGVFYQLVDRQIKVEKEGFKTSYSRYIETVVNQKGVEASSQINLEFDPTYQKIALNTLTVIRDGQRINRLQDAKMSVFSRETDLEKQIYSGKLTLNILLDNVQAGDTIDYSYTRFGSNPVYKNIFSFSQSLNWSVPVYKQHTRVLWGKSSPINIASRNFDPAIITTQMGDFTEYQISIQNEERVSVPSQIPEWYSPYGRVYFNELNSWQEVVAWAKPMYQFAPLHPTIRSVANEIALSSPSKSAQIAAALKYVQEKIRYVGLEMGENSHLPTAAEQTLMLKYGDCKDKVVLLIAILEALDIDAYPALVNSDNTKLLAEIPPSVNAFNHVIVWLNHADQPLWLDPTLSSQKGDLTHLYLPDYGYALILKEGVEKLTPMQKDESQSYQRITEQYRIPENDESPATYNVSTTYTGYGAMQKLWQLEQDGKSNVAEQYEVYYQRIFPSLTMIEEMQVKTDDASGELTISEQYHITKFWKMGDEHWEVDFYPTEIRDAIFKPKQSNRNAPLSFTYPNNIEQTVEVLFEADGWDFEPETFNEDNPFFSYSSKVNFSNNKLTLTYRYNAKTDHITHDKIDEYMEIRTRVRKDAYYGIIKYVKPGNSSANAADEDFELDWAVVIYTLYALGVIFIIVDWQIESHRRPEFSESHFYPIAAGKFVVLSAISFGVYNSYWMYRNWKSIKAKTKEHLAPFWRGFFVLFWVYPLFLRLKQDSEDNFQTNKVIGTWLAAIIALLFFAAQFASSISDNTNIILVYLLTPLLLLPFVRYINSRNEQTPDALIFNSKWRARQYVAALIFAPLLFFMVGSQTQFFPSDAVVTQSQIGERDLKFFYRHKLIPANEKIAYFYSDAIWDIKNDGNGFTENRVFSYWQDENGVLQKEVAHFNNIESIDATFTKSDLDNTIVTIIRKDKTDFMLFVSNVDKGDKLFVDELNKRWEANRTKDE